MAAFAEFSPYFKDVDAIFMGTRSIEADERYENSTDKIGIEFIVGIADARPKDKEKRLKLTAEMIYEAGGGCNLLIKVTPEEFQDIWAKTFRMAQPGSKWCLDLALNSMGMKRGETAEGMTIFTLLSAEAL